MIAVLIIISILFALYILSTMCRSGHPGLMALRGWAYAHRGLHGNGVPENSMEAFRRAKEAGYGIELDVHLLADGELAVMHDAQLRRTTGADGFIEDLTSEQLSAYKLESTDETIPLFRQVLELYSGKAPLIVELKSERDNYVALCQRVCEMLDGYRGVYCVESFDPRCIYWLRKNRPDIIRGQLTENYFVTPGSKLPWHLKLVLANQILNFLTQPDFVAYRFEDRKTLSNLLVRKFWGAQGVTWTLKSQEEYDTAVSENWIPIFEDFCP